MTFFRHFIQRQDFKTLVVTNHQAVKGYEIPYKPLHLIYPAWLNRISRTRLLPWIYGWRCLYGDHLLPKSILQAAKQFNPDAVFTVAGSWDWTALAAQRVAKQLNIPLVASFNDWFDYGWFPTHPSLHHPVERRFRRFYQQADLALCTSEGMHEALGDHPNAYVLYPTGAAMPYNVEAYQPQLPSFDHPLTVFFGGSLADWYGPMLEAVVRHCTEKYPFIQFRIFGSHPSWSTDFDQWAKEKNIFLGQVPFDQLCQSANQADLLLLPMGFSDDCAQVERTSFKTKFLDYLSFRRPILVWGPDYCSAVRVAREFDSAECVTTNDAVACAKAIYQLAQRTERRTELITNARHMYEDRFHPDLIHAGLVNKIKETIVAYEKGR